jgi:DNA-directed RNA polymerase specialized sigma24 family protein
MGEISKDSGKTDDIFVTTRWTMVLAAAERSSPQAERAMEEICSIYWFPIYAYIRRRNHSPEDAEDLTQEFFRCLCEKHWIGDADREKGKLRAFLITSLKYFLVGEHRKASAQKRGGGAFHLSIDTAVAEGSYASAVESPSVDAEHIFDRQWALTLLDRTMQLLKNESADAGKKELFSALKDGLFLSHQTIDYPALAQRLSNSEGALRVAVHRMRKRFREIYRREVAQTLPPGADLDEELHYLMRSLSRPTSG